LVRILTDAKLQLPATRSERWVVSFSHRSERSQWLG
jgi:hypothetical protein